MRSFIGRHPWLILAAVTLITAACGADTGTGGGTGLVTLTLSDPPTCQLPTGEFVNVFVTVTRVRAHLSAGVGAGDAEWVNLVDRTAAPVQVDLLSNPDTACILSTLGSTMGLPAGNYQQIRLHLLSNTPDAGVAVPAANACGAVGFNCAVLGDGSVVALDLSSQDTTGLKIPPGRIAGGAISLVDGQSADINIDFNICASFVRTNIPAGVPVQGPNGYRMRPALFAGEVALNSNSISGKVVDSATSAAIPGAIIMILAQLPDADNIGRVVMQTRANATDGTFQMCPLPTGDYDISVSVTDNAGVAHHPTMALEVPTGTDLGNVPVIPQVAPDTALGQIDGLVSSQTIGGTPTSINAVVSAVQPATPTGGTERLVVVPPMGSSTVSIATAPGSCPASTECANYMLFVPAGNPSIGTFDAGGTTYSAPGAAPNLYQINVQAFLPGTGHEDSCKPSTVTVTLDNGSNPLAVSAGITTVAAPITFTACTPVTP